MQRQPSRLAHSVPLRRTQACIQGYQIRDVYNAGDHMTSFALHVPYRDNPQRLQGLCQIHLCCFGFFDAKCPRSRSVSSESSSSASISFAFFMKRRDCSGSSRDGRRPLEVEEGVGLDVRWLDFRDNSNLH